MTCRALALAKTLLGTPLAGMWEESRAMEIRRAELLEAGLNDTQRDTEKCARGIMMWVPICCLVFLCGLGVIGLGWKGIVALFRL